MVLPKNPYRYAARLGNHPRLIAAIKAEEGSSLYPYKTADALRRLSLLLPQKPHEGSSAYAWMFFDTISPDALARYLQGFSNELMKTLYSARLLPLPGTLRMLERA
ncbi:hypothetical protein HY546_03720, partial [archaeon]|nr:hypothetical protein [archaeon]